ncbi:hypothetical protein Tco_0778620 [Tanacetum coccineum]
MDPTRRVRSSGSTPSEESALDLEKTCYSQSNTNNNLPSFNQATLQPYASGGQHSESNAAYFSWPTSSRLSDAAEERTNYFVNLQKGVLPESIGRLPKGNQATTLLELMTIRASHSKILRCYSLGTAIGFRIRQGVLTDLPAILVDRGVWCDVDVVEFSYFGAPELASKEQLYTYYPNQKMFHPLPPTLGPGIYLGAVERATSFITDDLWYGIFSGVNPYFLVVGENQQTFDLEGDSGSLIVMKSENDEKPRPIGIILVGTANRGRLKLKVGQPPENWTSGVDLGRLLNLLELDLITTSDALKEQIAVSATGVGSTGGDSSPPEIVLPEDKAEPLGLHIQQHIPAEEAAGSDMNLSPTENEAILEDGPSVAPSIEHQFFNGQSSLHRKERRCRDESENLSSGLGHYCPCTLAQPASYMTHPQANLVSSVPIQPAQVQPQPGPNTIYSPIHTLFTKRVQTMNSTRIKLEHDTGAASHLAEKHRITRPRRLLLSAIVVLALQWDHGELSCTTTSPIPPSQLHALRDPIGISLCMKFNADGLVEQYKARLVAKGPAIDVKNAFLHGQLLRHATCTTLGLVDFSHTRPLFAMTDLGSLNYFLGVSAQRSKSGLFLSQSKFAEEILERAHMQHCNPCKTPVDTESKLGSDGDPVSDPTLYRSLAGALQYLTFTRPDISYAVQQICLYMHDPRDPYFTALKRILRYVRGTIDHGLQLYVSSTSQLTAYTDADWAGCPVTRRSTSGYCKFLGDNFLSWSAKRQVTLSRSSAEAEYRGVANVVAETAWIRNLLLELHTPLFTATLVYCDNVSVVYLSTNPVQHQRTKHIEIDIHFVREYVASGQVRKTRFTTRLVAVKTGTEEDSCEQCQKRAEHLRGQELQDTASIRRKGGEDDKGGDGEITTWDFDQCGVVGIGGVERAEVVLVDGAGARDGRAIGGHEIQHVVSDRSDGQEEEMKWGMGYNTSVFNMATYSKPENALKRADELTNVGQNQDALQVLHDIITSRRYRAWQKPHEKIMFKYIELCVDMRRGRFAKDGLIQYRIICQQVNVASLEEVIKYFIDLSTKKAELARSQAQALEDALDVDDLEADKRPEDLMLSNVSGEKGKERSDRELVTPWFKFLWETYRTVLEILRNNSKLMALYAVRYSASRTTEFRRLCEIIRNHLANLNKYRDQRDRPDLSAPGSQHFFLDTRF